MTIPELSAMYPFRVTFSLSSLSASAVWSSVSAV